MTREISTKIFFSIKLLNAKMSGIVYDEFVYHTYRSLIVTGIDIQCKHTVL